MTAKAIMVQGTASSVGKSLLVVALCRIYRQNGYRVAPFKAQNMALNSAVTPDGLEIGRSTAVQAAAAGIEPSVDMNPILLKPEGESRSQLVLLGQPDRSMAARDYYARKLALWEVVASALERLRAAYDLVILEGAGSPAEVNLRATDIVNMRVAQQAKAPVLLVGDIDRGGVFASLLGTLDLLEPADRALVQGLIVNKFRGDASLFQSGVDFLAQRSGLPVLGVVPYIPRLRIAEEDSVALEAAAPATGGPLEVVVARLPRIANFDDFDLLAAEPAVTLRYVDAPEQVGTPDLFILPGSKATVADLQALRASGLADRITALAQAGTPVLGVCAGYQMLGERILDPMRVESPASETIGLGLLSAITTFQATKYTRRVQARSVSPAGCFGRLTTTTVAGYEIHMGATQTTGPALFTVTVEGEGVHPDGCRNATGIIAGCSLHGLFESPVVRRALIEWLAARRGLRLPDHDALPAREAEYDRLAATVRTSLDMDAISRLIGLEG